jgi:hypothetical protein
MGSIPRAKIAKALSMGAARVPSAANHPLWSRSATPAAGERARLRPTATMASNEEWPSSALTQGCAIWIIAVGHLPITQRVGSNIQGSNGTSRGLVTPGLAWTARGVNTRDRGGALPPQRRAAVPPCFGICLGAI